MSDSIHDVLLERAVALATQDGAAFGTLQLVAAANQLQSELIAARDRLIAGNRAAAVRVAPAAASDVQAGGGVPASDATDAQPERVAVEPVPATDDEPEGPVA